MIGIGKHNFLYLNFSKKLLLYLGVHVPKAYGSLAVCVNHCVYNSVSSEVTS